MEQARGKRRRGLDRIRNRDEKPILTMGSGCGGDGREDHERKDERPARALSA